MVWLGNPSQTFSRIIPQHCPHTSSFYTHLPAYEDGTVCSETSAYKIQTPGKHPKESIQHSGHSESLKSRSRKNVTSTALIFSSSLSFWWASRVQKSQSTQKNCTKTEKYETQAYRKKARGAVEKGHLICDNRECSVRLDKGRISESS